MTNGYTYEEKEILKTQVDVTELLKEMYHDDFLYRSNGSMVSKNLAKRSLVIYPKTDTNPSHGFIHHKERRQDDWKDNISVIEILFDCGFIDACKILNDYLYRTGEGPDIPHYGLFD